MDTPKQRQQNITQTQVEDEKPKTTKQQSTPSAPPSPPSATSSPSHEFSFTISLHPSTTTTTTADKTKPPTSFAIDLSPADDIFFHGHLLPLHLLSHLPVSPRSSTNSLESFTLPIRELIDDQKPNNDEAYRNTNINTEAQETKGRTKSKSFSLFGLSKWRKGYEEKEEDKEKQRKNLKLDIGNLLKKYAKMVRPLLFFKGREESVRFRRQTYSKQPCSYSGNISFREKQETRGKRGEFSAPASMRTSPTNSGLLVATATLPCSTSDSTMEELQAAIQAAIAHCKNSIAVEDKLKC